MLNLTIGTDPLKESIAALKAMVSESRFKFSPEGLKVNSVDQANVAMVSLELGAKAFTAFEATELELGIDITKLSSIIEMAQKDTQIGISLDEASHKLNINMGGLKYNMSLLDPSSIRKDPKIPTLDMPAKITIAGADMKYGIKATSKVGDYISFEADHNSFAMVANGDTDDVRFDAYLAGMAPAGRQAAELIGMDFTGTSKVASLYSIDYLQDIQKLMGNKEITINMGKDFPVKISYPIVEGNGHVTYMIAPRVESN